MPGDKPTRQELEQEVREVLSLRVPSNTSSAGQQQQQQQQLLAHRGNSSGLQQQPPSSRLLPAPATLPNGSGVALQASLDATRSELQQPGDQQQLQQHTKGLLYGKAHANGSAPPAAAAASGQEHASGPGGEGAAWIADMESCAPPQQQQSRSKAWWAHTRAAAKSVVRVVRAYPYVALLSLLATAALMTAGVVGVLAASNAEVRHRRDSAANFANNAAVAFEVQLQQTLAPLVGLAAMIHLQPYYPALAPRFDEIAKELITQVPVPGAVASLQMTPQGVVRSFYPLKGNEAALNHDLFRDPQRRGAALATVKNGNLTMQGPVMLLQGFTGAVARTPVFIPNVSETELFGVKERAYNCSICYDAATRTAFWGFVSCIVKLADLASGKDARVAQLAAMGYNYELFAPQPDKPAITIAASAEAPHDPVEATVGVPNNEWRLLIAPQQGWQPSWRGPMLATVIIITTLIGLLVLATLVSRHLQRWLLNETRATNNALAEEKRRMDVLLARQYNLISCMAEHGAVAGKALGGSSAGASVEQQTLDRIEHMRREIGVTAQVSGVDSVTLLELLGEGTFGKVFKGLWRGSTVAVKTMILPARMSGAEKRERMAIMEAAISSSMMHPNIVQTYTYTIQRATSTSASKGKKPPPHDPAASPLGSPDGTASSTAGSTTGFGGAEADVSTVHGFEVNLIIEYCDYGCVRDALDAGAFFSNGALNFLAILDTAADVAKAMVHLHCNQVVHSDLKCRNLLLKSDGSSERGCVAKVADFGLAVQMGHQDTHVSAFQGTLNHMAPEALLHGFVSKASDVYAFGVTLFELFTGGHAYQGIPRALLGHQVAVVGLRPAFPDFTPLAYRQLAESCWHPDPEQRPTFADILTTLTRLRQSVGGHTQPLALTRPLHGLSARTELAGQHEAGAAPPGAHAVLPARRTSMEQQQRVTAAQAAGLVQFEDPSRWSSTGLIDRTGSRADATGHPPHQQQQHQQQQEQPVYHHFSEVGAELDALQQLYEEQQGPCASDQSVSQQQHASGQQPSGQQPQQEQRVLTQAQQDEILMLYAQQRLWAQQWQNQQQQRRQHQQQHGAQPPAPALAPPLQPHHHHQQQQQQPAVVWGSGSFDRRGRFIMEPISDVPDEAADQSQHGGQQHGGQQQQSGQHAPPRAGG